MGITEDLPIGTCGFSLSQDFWSLQAETDRKKFQLLIGILIPDKFSEKVDLIIGILNQIDCLKKVKFKMGILTQIDFLKSQYLRCCVRL